MNIDGKEFGIWSDNNNRAVRLEHFAGSLSDRARLAEHINKREMEFPESNYMEVMI